MEKRYEYKFAYSEYKKISIYLAESGYKHEESGSLRRKKKDIGDIDIIVCGKEMEVLEYISNYKEVDYRIDHFEFMLKSGIAVHIIPETKEMYNYTLWQSTGSKDHVKQIKNMYTNKNKKIKMNFNLEKEIYDEIGMEFLKPEERI